MRTARIRALIVDDERLARSELRAMLEEYKNVEVVGEADSVESAARKARKLKPDLVFLDIQMPGKSGFELLSLLDRSIRVIFVTAFDNYAVRAFETNSLDYLLKPVSPERLARSVERWRSAFPRFVVTAKNLPSVTEKDTLFLQSGNQRDAVRVEDIRAVYADDQLTRIVVGRDKIYSSYEKLQKWENRLPPAFVRVHRSTIVNTRYIERVVSNGNNTSSLFLRDLPEPFTVSRRYGRRVRDAVSPS